MHKAAVPKEKTDLRPLSQHPNCGKRSSFSPALILLDSEADADGENGPTWGHLLADELNSIRAHLMIDHPRGPHVSTNIDTDYSADY